MTRLTAGFHPDFDALSAHADRSDTEAARTKVGRHVADCDVCRATVEEIRALGAAARRGDAPAAPQGMWARIERAIERDESVGRAQTEREVAVSATSDDAPRPDAPASTRKRSTVRRSVLGLVALFAVISTVLVFDSRDPLAAATPRRLTTDREAARAGTVITLHYRPIPALADHQTLTVWMLLPGRGEHRYDQDLERGGVLHRMSALDFTGTIVMPDSAPLVMFTVGDSGGDIIDRTELRNGRLPLVVLTADSAGRPRLDAFIAALSGSRGLRDRGTMSRWAEQMRELYPGAPETWILGAVHARRGVIADIVKLFESRERQYDGWHDRLEHRTALSAETEVMMATLGWELMDTARAEFWTRRLMQDHPTSASVPGLWIRPYRDVPDDSAATVLRAFEPIYAAADNPPYDALSRALALADRSGDSVLIRRWHLRLDPREVSWLLGADLNRLVDEPAERADLKRRLLVALAESDSAMHGGPTLVGRSRYFAWIDRQRLRTRLAALQLIEGDAKGAREELDTIVRETEARPSCPLPETMRWRAETSRRLGQMTIAEADFAYVVVTGDWRIQALSDSMPVLLGDSYSKTSWDQALADANALKRGCWAASRDARRASATTRPFDRPSDTLSDGRFLIRRSVVLLAGSAAFGGFRRFPMRLTSAQ